MAALSSDPHLKSYACSQPSSALDVRTMFPCGSFIPNGLLSSPGQSLLCSLFCPVQRCPPRRCTALLCTAVPGFPVLVLLCYIVLSRPALGATHNLCLSVVQKFGV